MRRDVVVVLNYNGWDDTERCVRSLLSGSPDAKVIVVDNGSETGFSDDVADRWPGVVTLRNDRNLGFTGGMNVGVRAALERDADTVTILNNDTVVSAGAIALLGSVAETGVAVSPEVRYLDRPEEVWFGGGAVNPTTNLPHHVAPNALPAPGADGLRPTDMLAGCCVTATADTWHRVGFLDERYFLNFEDSDWSMRARAAGVPLVVDTRVTIEHAVSASFTGAYSYLGLYYYARNGLLFGREHGRRPFPANVRFLRRHVLPDVVGRARRGSAKESVRRMAVLGYALTDVVRGRFGAAPQSLVERATRWSSPSVRQP